MSFYGCRHHTHSAAGNKVSFRVRFRVRNRVRVRIRVRDMVRVRLLFSLYVPQLPAASITSGRISVATGGGGRGQLAPQPVTPVLATPLCPAGRFTTVLPALRHANSKSVATSTAEKPLCANRVRTAQMCSCQFRHRLQNEFIIVTQRKIQVINY